MTGSRTDDEEAAMKGSVMLRNAAGDPPATMLVSAWWPGPPTRNREEATR